MQGARALPACVGSCCVLRKRARALDFKLDASEGPETPALLARRPRPGPLASLPCAGSRPAACSRARVGHSANLYPPRAPRRGLGQPSPDVRAPPRRPSLRPLHTRALASRSPLPSRPCALGPGNPSLALWPAGGRRPTRLLPPRALSCAETQLRFPLPPVNARALALNHGQ